MCEINEDEQFGYKKIKEEVNLNKFYKNEYYETFNDRTIDNNSDDKCEIKDIEESTWLEQTYFEELRSVMEENLENLEKKILDIGSGHGELIKYMNKYGWKTKGIEPSKSAYEYSINQNLDIENLTIDKFFEKNKEKFSCINLNNVLEHIPEPLDVLEKCKSLLWNDGIIRIKVPNDFNKLQIIANKYVENKEWWICSPDHVNYFDKKSLEKLLKYLDFEIIYTISDFPMEMFLLMGDNYIDNKNIGKECHERRKKLETTLPDDFKIELYKQFYNMNIGRNIIIYAKKKK